MTWIFTFFGFSSFLCALNMKKESGNLNEINGEIKIKTCNADIKHGGGGRETVSLWHDERGETRMNMKTDGPKNVKYNELWTLYMWPSTRKQGISRQKYFSRFHRLPCSFKIWCGWPIPFWRYSWPSISEKRQFFYVEKCFRTRAPLHVVRWHAC